MDGIEACTQKWTSKEGERERERESCTQARRRRRREGRKFRRGGQICKALELRGRASHLIRRRFYSPRCPNLDKPSAIREAAPPSPPPTSSSTSLPVCVLSSLWRGNFVSLLKMSCGGWGDVSVFIWLTMMMMMRGKGPRRTLCRIDD